MKGDQAQVRGERQTTHQKRWGKLGFSRRRSHLFYVLTTFCFLGVTAGSLAAIKRPDVEIKIGIVQRFGDEPTDQLNLQAAPGDRLTLSFKGDRYADDANGVPKPLLQASSIKLEVAMQSRLDVSVGWRIIVDRDTRFHNTIRRSVCWLFVSSLIFICPNLDQSGLL